MHFLPESHAFTHKATLTSHWHSWRITLDESPVTISIWGLRALAVNQNTEVVLGWCREQLVDAQGRSHLHFQSVLPHYLCHRATSSTVAFYVLIFFLTHSDFCLQFDLLFARDVYSKGNWVATPWEATGLPHHVRPNILMSRVKWSPRHFFTYTLLQLKWRAERFVFKKIPWILTTFWSTKN